MGVNKLKLVPIWRHGHIFLGKGEKYVDHNQTIAATPAKITIFFAIVNTSTTFKMPIYWFMLRRFALGRISAVAP